MKALETNDDYYSEFLKNTNTALVMTESNR